MFDFDSGTGHISNVYNIQNLLNKQDDVYGFEFSPNDSILYICTFEEGSFVTHLYQLDLHSQLITDLNIPFESTPGGLQLGPDNKIYCNCKGAPHNALSIVHNPNKLGISCLFEYNALLLAPGTLSLAGFPAPSPYSFFLDSSSIPSLGKDTNVCTGSSLVLNPHFPTNCDSTSFLWSDGSTGTEITVDKSGEFWVEINSSCGSFKDTIQVDFTSCVPILYYDLEVCKANMIDGSNMDYSEFTPAYPNQICGEVKAGNVFRSSLAENKHSCTPGVGNSVAMCISSLNSCSYSPGHQGSLIFEVMIIPDPDTTIWIKGLEFYEKGPTTYSWINGPSGLNNYPLYYGIRILKNSTEIYHKENIPTSVTWSLQRFNFLDDTLFRVEENTTFRIELLPYCPVGNGADVSAWDIDEIKIFGGCASVEGFKPVIKGEVKTQENQAISGAEMHLSQDPSFSVVDKILTEETGIYLFDQLETGRSYFVKGNKNDDVLNGVSTLDLIYIQKHLLGITPFTTLYQYIAADVNHSGYVSVIDLLDLRKLLLGIYSEFPNNTSWRFGSWPQEMNGTQISHFGEVSSIEYLDKDTQIVDFVGIKTGDLNGDVRLQGQSSAIEIRNRNQLEFLIDDQEMIAGIPFILRIKSGEESLLAGFQFALDLHGMEFISLNSSTIPISQENYS
ncbi:MAG: hypothetical protein ABIQ02_08305, partial [Saprospiraceae bacterium]